MKPEEFDTTLEADRGTTEPAMMVDVEGFEGPLDLLLALARTQKVDLAKISILALADQYLQFIEAARKLRLELAAAAISVASGNGWTSGSGRPTGVSGSSRACAPLGSA